MFYINPQGQKIEIATPYDIDITSDILFVGNKAIKNLATGWFAKKCTFPSGNILYAVQYAK